MLRYNLFYDYAVRGSLEKLTCTFDINLPRKVVEISLNNNFLFIDSKEIENFKNTLLDKLLLLYKTTKHILINSDIFITSSQIKDISLYLPIIEKWCLQSKLTNVTYITYIHSDIKYKSSIVAIKYINSITYTIAETCKQNYLDTYKVNNPVNYKYNYLTYSKKPIRSYMYTLLKKYSLLDSGIVSYNQQQSYNYDEFRILPTLIGITEKEFKDNQDDSLYVDLSESYVANNNFRMNAFCHCKSLFESIQSTAVSIVSEATNTNSYNFITEKTFNNFGLKKPFLLIGDRGNLKFLRDHYGFKTFSSLWDESYDLEDDPYTRAAMVFSILHSLCKLPLTELQNNIATIDHILEHNYKVYTAMPHKKIVMDAII
jgi:hypothetical protein